MFDSIQLHRLAHTSAYFPYQPIKPVLETVFRSSFRISLLRHEVTYLHPLSSINQEMLEKLLIFLDCPLVMALLLFFESDVVHVSLSALFS